MKSKDNFERSVSDSEIYKREIKRVDADFPVWMVKIWISDCLRSENKLAL